MTSLFTMKHECLVGAARYFAVTVTWDSECQSNPPSVEPFPSWATLTQFFEGKKRINTRNSTAFPVRVVWGDHDEWYTPTTFVRQLSIQEACYLDHHIYPAMTAIRQFIDDELQADAKRIQAEDESQVPPTDPDINIQ